MAVVSGLHLCRCSGQVLPASSLKNSVVLELIHEAYKYIITVGQLVCLSVCDDDDNDFIGMAANRLD